MLKTDLLISIAVNYIILNQTQVKSSKSKYQFQTNSGIPYLSMYIDSFWKIHRLPSINAAISSNANFNRLRHMYVCMHVPTRVCMFLTGFVVHHANQGCMYFLFDILNPTEWHTVVPQVLFVQCCCISWTRISFLLGDCLPWIVYKSEICSGPDKWWVAESQVADKAARFFWVQIPKCGEIYQMTRYKIYQIAIKWP
jgi:hypothetical protein